MIAFKYRVQWKDYNGQHEKYFQTLKDAAECSLSVIVHSNKDIQIGIEEIEYSVGAKHYIQAIPVWSSWFHSIDDLKVILGTLNSNGSGRMYHGKAMTLKEYHNYTIERDKQIKSELKRVGITI